MDAHAANATTYPDRYRAVLKKAPALGAAQPDVMKSFGGLHKAGTATGAFLGLARVRGAVGAKEQARVTTHGRFQ